MNSSINHQRTLVRATHQGPALGAVFAIAVISFNNSCSAESPRVTPLVKVIQEIEPAVVSLFVPDDNNRLSSGSGTIIHPDGYVLTNNHVLPKAFGFALVKEQPVRFDVVGRLPEKDIAIIKLRGVTGSLPHVPLGNSHDLMNGESVVVAGNPGGRGTTFTSGIVSAKHLVLSMPNALVYSQYKTSRRDAFIQFDAASNRGNSGGPLINMEGNLIGIVSALIPQEQNVGFAIPVDRVRDVIQQVVEPELISQRSLGMSCNLRSEPTLVVGVVADSPADQAGVRIADEIVSLNGRPIRNAVDWNVMLYQFLPQGQPLDLIVRRDGKEVRIQVTAERLKPTEPVAAEDTVPGLAYSFYHGKHDLLPDFDSLTEIRSGVVSTLDLDEIRQDRDEEFLVRVDGFLEIAEEGLYRITLRSDDGSRLYFHDEILIDHDGTHPATDASNRVRVKAGLHPVRIEYFESGGEQALSVALAKVDQRGAQEESVDIKWLRAK